MHSRGWAKGKANAANYNDRLVGGSIVLLEKPFHMSCKIIQMHLRAIAFYKVHNCIIKYYKIPFDKWHVQTIDGRAGHTLTLLFSEQLVVVSTTKRLVAYAVIPTVMAGAKVFVFRVWYYYLLATGFSSLYFDVRRNRRVGCATTVSSQTRLYCCFYPFTM